VLDRVGIDRTDVVSASYGSTIAYEFARTFPERVERLVLAGVMREIPAHMRQPTAHTLVTLEEGRMAEFAREVADGLLCRDPAKTIERRELARRLLLSQLERMGPSEKQRYVHGTRRLLCHPPLDLSCPPPVRTLVFTGEHDVYTRPEYCREIASAFSDSTSTTILNADHLFHIERFAETLELLSTFLNDRPVTAVAGVYGRVQRSLGLEASVA
jgi:pimeloyl-ACP methyl ester carboxylesterase